MQELPLYPTLASARLAALDCVACGRAAERTQVVFGAGNSQAALMLVGEAPSSTDDQTGKPFTGPAGKLLDRLFEEIGVQRRDVWITNLTRCYAGVMRNGRAENRPVKAGEIKACRTWMDLEISYVNPKVLLAVGAPAAKQLIGPEFRLKEQHGEFFERADGRLVTATVQPAYVMRLLSIAPEAYDFARASLVVDLQLAAATAGLIELPPVPQTR